MNGTWKVTDGGGGHGGRLALVAVAVAALVSWLATVLLILAIVAVTVVIALVGGVLLLRRLNTREGSEELARQAAALHADVALQAARPAVVNHYHGGTHMHLGPGADAAAIIRQAAQSGTVVPEIRE
jgi:hypothetical protein